MSIPTLCLSVRYMRDNQCITDKQHVVPIHDNLPHKRLRGFTLAELTYHQKDQYNG